MVSVKIMMPSPQIYLNRRVRMFPILFFQFYLGITVLIFAFGPWTWPVPDPMLLYLFLLAAHISLWLGYINGLRVRPGGYYNHGRWTIWKLLKISLILNLIWIIPKYMLALNIDVPNINQIFLAIWNGISDPGSAYRLKFVPLEERTGSPLGYLTILMAPILWMLLPLSIIYWKHLPKRFRYLFIFVTFAGLLKWVAIGTTKGIADIAFLSTAMIVASNPNFIAHINISKRKAKIILFSVFALLLLLFYFLYMQHGRMEGRHRAYFLMNPEISLNHDSWIFLLTSSETLVDAISKVTSYMVQGYYGLSLALNENFQWTYGVGNSFFLTGITEKFVGRGVIFGKTYPARVEQYGWGAHNNWHTFYTWIASDVTFIGAIIVVFFIGKIFAIAWLDTLNKENPFAVSLFALLIIMLMYFPANNQVLAFPDTGPAFLAILVAWLYTRKRRSRF